MRVPRVIARVAAAGCGLAQALAIATAAAQDAGPTRPSYSTSAELVVLHVSVVDGRSGFVRELPREAFTVYEDGRPQEIRFFEHEDTPATIGLVMDSSGSMHRKRDALLSAGLAFAQSGHPDDELFVMHFNERVWSGLPPGRPFTSDLAEFRAALHRSTARGRTALFDAVAAALEHLERGTARKKALVVLSDGGDNASARRFAEVLHEAHRSNAIVYGIALTDQYDDREGDPDVLKELARATGGEAFFPRRLDDVRRVLERVARDIRSGYTIGYVPSPGAAGATRAVRVDVAAGDRVLTARARSAYAGME